MTIRFPAPNKTYHCVVWTSRYRVSFSIMYEAFNAYISFLTNLSIISRTCSGDTFIDKESSHHSINKPSHLPCRVQSVCILHSDLVWPMTENRKHILQIRMFAHMSCRSTLLSKLDSSNDYSAHRHDLSHSTTTHCI